MDISQLCDLIKTCGESGVSELSFDTLHVKFARTSPATKREEAQAMVQAVADPVQESRDLLQETITLREDDLAMKLITDPAEYERLLVAGELEGGESVQHR